MISRSNLKQVAYLLIVGGLPFTAASQSAFRTAPVPRDGPELVSDQIQVAATDTSRDAVFQLLTKARNNYALRNARQAWDLKVHFSVDSQGETNYDGEWMMEDRFAPGLGLRWTATFSPGFIVTGIFLSNAIYAEGTGNLIPLRLQEARAMLYNPIASIAYADSGSIRTSSASFHGSPVTCILLARSRNATHPPSGRGWDETEDCIDSQSGLLQMHSEVPGRYVAYDYTNGARLGSHILPRTITVTEAGRIVSTISVDSLQVVSSVDASLFTPTEGMKAAGPATAMTSATWITRIQGQGAPGSATTLRPVCVFGLITPAGKLVEAHSLQPSDPNSEAAVRDAKSIDFSPSTAPGTPQQHFVFVIEKFVSPESGQN